MSYETIWHSENKSKAVKMDSNNIKTDNLQE